MNPPEGTVGAGPPGKGDPGSQIVLEALGHLTAQFSRALLTGTALLTGCLVAVVGVLVPAHRAAGAVALR